MAVEGGAPVNETTGSTAQIVDTIIFAAIATTSSTNVTAGSSQTITVASGTGIVVGMWLTFDTGFATETQQVAVVSGTAVTAFFANAHTGTYNVVANVNRQIVGIGDPVTQGRILTIDAGGSLYATSPVANTVMTGKTASATSATLCAARTSPPRKALVVYNSSTTATAYIAEGSAASIASGGFTYAVPPGATLEIYTVYTGAYNYISTSADGSYLNVTERY